MICTVMGAVGGAIFGVWLASSDGSHQYTLVTTVAITLGFFTGRGVDIIAERWREW